MVFSGKPSTGCQMCRTRRIKCDEAKPACNQCIRTGRSCPGYKSKLDLLFRNETGASAAEKRARTAARKKAAKRQGESSQQQQHGGESSSSTRDGKAPAVMPTRMAAGRTDGSSGNSSSSGSYISRSSKSESSNSSTNDIKNNNMIIDTLGKGVISHRGQKYNDRTHGSYSYGDLGDFRIFRDEDYDDDDNDNDNDRRSRSSRSSSSRRRYRGSIAPALCGPPDELAVCHFLSNFVLVPLQGSSRGYMDFLVPMLKTAESPTSLFASERRQNRQGPGAAGPRRVLGAPGAPGASGDDVGTAENSDSLEARAAFTFAFRACALASMSTRVASNSFHFADKALSAYTRALAATHLALQDPALSRADSTLAAVLLLSLFESITAKQMGLFAWGSHIEGAIEIVKARTLEQRRTQIGRSLFIAVRTQMTIHILASGKSPDFGHDWWMEGSVNDISASVCQHLGLRTAELSARVADYIASATNRSPENVARIMAFAEEAQSLDRECVAWVEGLSPDWQYETVAWQDKLPNDDYSRAEAFPGRVDVYRDLYTVSVWNSMRGTRLFLAAIGVRCAAWACAPADHRTTSQYAAAAHTCSDIISDIIASVPFYLGWHHGLGPSLSHGPASTGGLRYEPLSPPSRAPSTSPQSPRSTPATTPSPRSHAYRSLDPLVADHEHKPLRHGPLPSAGSHLSFVCGDDSGLKGLAGYFLGWTLASISSQDYITDNQRAWVRGRLKYISSEVGVRYAGIVAELEFRMPSMIIQRDRLVAMQKQQAAAGKEAGPPGTSETSATSAASPTTSGGAGVPPEINPLQQWEALQKMKAFGAEHSELPAKATAKSGPYGKRATANKPRREGSQGHMKKL